MARNAFYRKIMLCAALLLLVMVRTSAAVEPALGDIIANVTKAMVPGSNYQVIVTQRIETMITEQLTTAVEAPTEEGQFILLFDMTTGVSTSSTWAEPVTHEGATEALAEGSIPLTTIGPVPTVRLRFDIKKILAQVQIMDNVIIGTEQYNDRSYWKIIAQKGDGSQGLGYILWIDSEQWTVSKVTVKVSKYDFTDSVLTYSLVSGLWLPKMIITTFIGDGTRVTQQYGEYVFTN